MKKLFWLLLFVPALAYSQPSLCTVTGTVYTPDGDTAKGAIITVVKAVKGGVLISKQSKDYRADKNGAITLLLHRGSTTWLYGEIAGMDSLGKAGVPVVVPDNPTATLSTLVNTSVPPRYTVLIGSAADTAYSVRITHPSIPGFTGVNAADTNKVLYVDENGNIKETWKGGGGAAIDTSGAFALTVAQGAVQKADTGALHAQKFATPTPHYISLAPQSTVTHQEGRFYYDSDTDALTVYNAETDVALQVGEENWVRARNNTGAIISNGQVVYISGAIGQNPTIALARADAAATSCVIGVATHDIGVNEVGYVTTHGLVNDLNLTNYGDGSEVWLSADSAGHFTLNKPTAAGHRRIIVGHVAYSHGTLGKLLVQIREPEDLDRLSGFADADSVHAVLDTVGNFALSVAQSAAVEADTAGNFALNVAQSATVTANAALPKADTTNQVRTTHPNIPGLAADTLGRVMKIGATGNLFVGYLPASGLTTVDSAIQTTKVIDTTGRGVSGTYGVDSVFQVAETRIFLPRRLPDYSTNYDGFKRIGYVEYEMVIGGNLLRAATDPLEFTIYCDSTNNVELRYVRIEDVAMEATTQGLCASRTTLISFSSTGGTGAMLAPTALLNGTGGSVVYTPYSLGTKKKLKIMASSTTDNINWAIVTIKAGFVIPQGNSSTWYAKIGD